MHKALGSIPSPAKTKENHHHPAKNRNKLSKRNVKLNIVAHTCNPSYSGGKDQEDQGSRPAWAKSKIPYQQKKLGMVACASYPSYVGSISRIVAQTCPGKNVRPHLKNN
jgi:hypothetical protein